MKVGLRTMVGSRHHLRHETTRKILENSLDNRQPFLVLEISDNSYPKAIWWIAFPINILTSCVVTFFGRDEAVSNARTYTLHDLDNLFERFDSYEYAWEKE